MQDRSSDTLPLHRLYPQQIDDLPRPPFSASFHDYLILGLAWDRSAIRHLVPEELELSDPVTGFIATGQAPSGWGVPPFSNFYLALAVGGLPSPDGTPGHFRPVNLYSPQAARIFRHHYNVLMDDGDLQHRTEGGRSVADICGGGLQVRLVVHNSGAPHQPSTGVHHYLGQDSLGEITSFHTSYRADFAPVEVETLEIAGPAAARLPLPQIQWATHSNRLDVTIGEPRGSPFASVAGGQGAAALTTLLSRIGLAAACLGNQGQVLSANAAARAVLRQVGPGLLARLSTGGPPRALDRVQTGLPVIAQTLALDPALLNQPACLVLFRDPSTPARGDSSAVLELLGLTPAEARLAAAVGSGMAPAGAAERLGISTNTARSTLQQIYGKLQIGRQSELARIVSHIITGGDLGRVSQDE